MLMRSSGGRRPVAVVSLLVGTICTMVFFVGSGWVLWVFMTVAIVAAAPATPAIGTLDAELLQLMERAGCYSLAVGIESGSQRILDLMKKDLTIEEIEYKVALIKRVTKIKVTGFFIIGYPGETKDEIKQETKAEPPA